MDCAYAVHILIIVIATWQTKAWKCVSLSMKMLIGNTKWKKRATQKRKWKTMKMHAQSEKRFNCLTSLHTSHCVTSKHNVHKCARVCCYFCLFIKLIIHLFLIILFGHMMVGAYLSSRRFFFYFIPFQRYFSLWGKSQYCVKYTALSHRPFVVLLSLSAFEIRLWRIIHTKCARHNKKNHNLLNRSFEFICR